MATYGISKPEPEHIYVILVLPSGERVCSLRTDACLITQVAGVLGLNLYRITVSFDNSIIDMGLTLEDCCIVKNSRLTVARFIKNVPVVGVFTYLLHASYLCRTNACGGYIAPLGTLFKGIISFSYNKKPCYVGLTVFTGDTNNNRDPYVMYHTPYSIGCYSELSLGHHNIMDLDLDLESNIELKCFLENNEHNLSLDKWEEMYELKPVL